MRQGAANFFTFFGKIETSPDTDGFQNGILWMKFPENFEVEGRLLAVYYCLGVIMLQPCQFVFADLFFSKFSPNDSQPAPWVYWTL